MYEELTECPDCKELAIITSSNFNASISCGCGIVKVETMVEEDRLYPIYQQVFGAFVMTNLDFSDLDKHSGSLKDIQHNRPHFWSVRKKGDIV